MTTLSSFAVTNSDTRIRSGPHARLRAGQPPPASAVYISVSGFAADQDLAYFQFKPTTTGSVGSRHIHGHSYEIDPGPMGASDAPSADDWSFFNLLNGTPHSMHVERVRDRTAPGNTSSALCRLPKWRSDPFKIGTQVLTSGSSGTYGVLFGNNANRVK